MAQTLLPDGNSSTTNWIQAGGDSDADWFDELDEGVAGNDGDTTSWRSPLSPVNEAIAVTLQNATDPAASTGHIIRAVWRKNSTAGRTLSGKLELLQGANVIATSTDSDVAENTFQTFTYTLSGTEADSITDYTDLILRVTANDESGAGAGRLLILTALEMEVPDAAAGATLTQDGYRFYDDDGGEGAATPLAGEDTDAEVEPETNVRLRVQLDADGDADAAQYRIDFRRMALTTLEDNFGDGSMDTDLWTKEAYLVGTNQDVTVVEASGVVTITPVADTAGENYNGYQSVDTFDFTGMAASCAITEVAQDINEIAVFVDSANSFGYDIEGGVLYFFIRLDDDPSDQTNITYSATTHKYLRIRHDAGTDEIVWETSPDNADWTERRRADRPFAITNMGLNIFGGTYGSRSSPGQMVFDDAWLGTIDGDWTAVAASATDVLLAASTNITASGENTTAQLTAPAGKTTGDFEAGRIQDDENPADSIDLTADAYTELEWCIEFAAGVDAGTDYQFRLSIGGTALDSYAVTPTLTVAAAGGAMSGTSAGAATATGTLTGSGELAGSSAGVATPTGALTGSGALAGTTAGAATATAALTAIGALSGTSAGQATVTGALVADGALSGAAAGTATVTGALDATGALAGVAAGVATVTGNLTAATSGAISGTAAGSATVTGALTAGGALSGTSAGVATATGALVGTGALAGAAAGIATVTGNLTDAGEGDISGTAAGVATVTGALTGAGALSGTTAGAATATATLSGAGALAGSTAGSATVTGAMLAIGTLSGTAAGAATATGALTGDGALAGTAAGSAIVTGALTALGSNELSGTSAGAATVTGTLAGLGALSGSTAGVATVTAALDGIAVLSGIANGVATVTGALVGTGTLSGTAAGVATVSGAIIDLSAIIGSFVELADSAMYVVELEDSDLYDVILVDTALYGVEIVDSER